MDEQAFLDSLGFSPGDSTALQQYADWLCERNDSRGPHLAAELALYRAREQLHRASNVVTEHRSRESHHFDWLNKVFPFATYAGVSGTIHRAKAPDAEPLVSIGQMVDYNTTIAIVESGRVFYHATAGHSGMVTEILFEDATHVNVGDRLLNLIRPQLHQVHGAGS